MKLTPYNVKIKVYCKDENEARSVQNAILNASSDFNIIGEELLHFYTKYKQNEGMIKPILLDVIRNGIASIAKHIPKLLKLK